MQRRRWLLMLLLTLGCLASADLGSQTRAQDAADPRRRCTLSFQPEEMPERKAIRCAEWFIAVQGYTSAAPASDTALIVSDPYDLLESKRSVTYWLFHRRGTLEPQAFGLCIRTGGFAYTVLFRYAAGAGRPVGRGVSMDSTYGSLRMVHGDFEFPGVLTIGCRLLASTGK